MSSVQRTGLLLLVVLSVLVGGAWQAAEKAPVVQKWEYKEVFYSHDNAGRGGGVPTFDKSANELGEQGWELVATMPSYAYFKRPKQ